VTSPPALQGKKLEDITDEQTVWYEELRTVTATITSTSQQIIACPIITPPNETPETVVNLARGYGDQTLMGSTPMPSVTPGPHSTSGYPSLNTEYTRVRNCPAHY